MSVNSSRRDGAWAIIDIAAVDRAIDSGLSLLQRSFLPSSSGVGGGWYHELRGPYAGPTATAVGVSAFRLHGKVFSREPECLAFLRSRQVTSQDPVTAGGWATNASPGQPVVESTAWVTRMLGQTYRFPGPQVPDVAGAVGWLTANQNPDGGWGSLAGNPSRVWTTCLAMRALRGLAPDPASVTNGLRWLAAHQHASGGWGQQPGEPPTVTHTSMVLITCAEAGLDAEDQGFLRGLDWLEGRLDRNFEEDRDARVEMYDVTSNLGSTPQRWRNTVPHYGLPYSLSALLLRPERQRPDLIGPVVHRLLDQQLNDGRWPSVEGGAVSSMWSLYPHLEALAHLRAWTPISSGAKITVLHQAVLVQLGEARTKSLATLVHEQRRRGLERMLLRYWTTGVLSLATLIGLVAVAAGRFEWKDFWLGLAVPILLFLVQESRSSRD